MSSVTGSKEGSMRGLFGVVEVANYWSVSPWTIRKWIQEGRIASVRLGGRRLIPALEVERVINEGVEPNKQKARE